MAITKKIVNKHLSFFFDFVFFLTSYTFSQRIVSIIHNKHLMLNKYVKYRHEKQIMTAGPFAMAEKTAIFVPYKPLTVKPAFKAF